MTGRSLDHALAGIGRLIGKPPGWERIVRALAPPEQFSGRPVRCEAIADGYEFPTDPGTLIGWSVHFFGSYEPEVRDQLRRRLQPGDVAIDVGANVGWHALLMATLVGPSGRVYAFEPNESTRARLADAVARNRCSQLIVDSRAVTDREGVAAFAAPIAGDLWDGTGRLVSGGEEGPDSVPCTTIDRFVEEGAIPRVALMKIDVEGWEPSVLAGACRTLAAHRPVLLFEFDPAYIGRSGSTGAALTAFLTGAGYALYRLDPRRDPRRVDGLGDRVGNFMALPR